MTDQSVGMGEAHRANRSRPSLRPLLILTGILLTLTGCLDLPANLKSPARYDYGMIYVLPGIEGRSTWNRDIAAGLGKGGVASAIEIYDWTIGLPGGYYMNLVDLERNREEAVRFAAKITEYQNQHPGRPVFLVGHSGGAGVAVLALEALPPDRRIDSAILLAAALSPEYNLAPALQRTAAGITSFYSEEDVGFLKVGTSAVGNIDRVYTEAAGAVGFRQPPDLSAADAALYKTRLHQIKWNERLDEAYDADGSHLGWASPRFAESYLSQLIRRREAARPLPATRPVAKPPK